MSRPEAQYPDNDFYAPLKRRRDAIEARYRERTPQSAALSARAAGVMPGGYSRDAVIRSPYAPYFVRGEGTELVDVDGNRVTDLAFNATSLPVGHAHPAVVAAVSAQIPLGSAYYGRTPSEIELAEIICERLPSAEQIRFTNSGSEAVMMALRLARAHTGRSLIVKFEGSYHGSHDDVQWSVGPDPRLAGDPRRPVAVPDTAGLPPGEGRVLVVPYNDPEALADAMSAHGADVAAVIVEPMANRMGLVVPDAAFLEAAREQCTRHGAVLIFDEVIAFRIGYHGAQGALGVTPDLTALGKVIGGGYPVGAVTGSREILAVSDPGRPGRMTHAGTFNANPVTMIAGATTLSLLTPEVFGELAEAGAYARDRLAEACDGLPLTVTGVGSLFKVNATARPIRCYRDTVEVDKDWQQLASLALLNEGYYLSTGLQGCVATCTTRAQIDGLVDAFTDLVRG